MISRETLATGYVGKTGMEHRHEGKNKYLEEKGSKLSEKMIGISEMGEKISAGTNFRLIYKALSDTL